MSPTEPESGHEITLRRMSRKSPDVCWRSTCSCGWASRIKGRAHSADRAEKAGADHKKFKEAVA